MGGLNADLGRHQKCEDMRGLSEERATVNVGIGGGPCLERRLKGRKSSLTLELFVTPEAFSPLDSG